MQHLSRDYCESCPRACFEGLSATSNDCARDTLPIRGKSYCGAPPLPVVALSSLHKFEEPIISGINGSGTVFFSGCNLKCVFCQNNAISHKLANKAPLSPLELSEIFRKLESEGAHNINLVTPTCYADGIIKALDIYKPRIPIVYNTSGYETIANIDRLAGYIDVYLPDIKYYSADLSEKYSDCKDYFAYTSAAVKQMRKQVGADVIEGGLIKRGLIIRHLVLPSHYMDSLKIIDWISENLSDSILSLMSQYCPIGDLESFKEINRKLTTYEYQKVLNHVEKLGLKGYCQDISSAKTAYIPNWNL